MKNRVPGTFESQLSNADQITRWPAGEILFREGEEPRGVFVLHSGMVDLVFSTRNGIHKSLRTAHPGEIVGLSDAISNTRYDCTATTRTSARILFVPLAELRRQLDETPALWFKIAQLLSEDLNSCWASMRRLSAAR